MNVVSELYRLPVKSSPCVPLMRKPTLPSLPAKCRPLPMHLSSSYVLGQACFNLISGLSAQTSLKRFLPGAKVMLFLPGKANGLLWSTGISLTKDHNWLHVSWIQTPDLFYLAHGVLAQTIYFQNFESSANIEKSEAFT